MATTRRRRSSHSLTLSFLPIVDPVRDVLDSHVRHFSALVGWATVVVAVGVALEGIEVAHDIIAWAKRKYREKRERADLKELANIFPCGETRGETESHADHPRWVKRWLRVGLILVVVGVIGEWHCGAKLEDAHNAVHLYDLAKLAAADEKAVDAATSAKTAHEDAEGAKKDAKDATDKSKTAKESADAAQKKVGSALAGVTELQARLAWRTISDEQRKTLKEELQPFRGRKVRIIWSAGEPEQNAFASQLVDALHNAQLDVQPTFTEQLMVAPNEVGILGIILEGSDDVFLQGFSKALVCSSLVAIPVPLVRQPSGGDSITVVVRPKGDPIKKPDKSICPNQ
jgi:hypothetical protein